MSSITEPTTIRNLRLIIHLLAFLILFVPYYLPMPFAPQFLHDIFGAKNGALLAVLVLLFYVLFIFSLIICFLFELIHRRFNEPLLLEIVCIPVLMIAFAFLLSNINRNTFEKIAALNSGRSPREFQNPYLEYKMLDCRNITDHFDVIFIPQHLGIETDYLAYAPRRSNKSGGIKQFENDWYLEHSGSQWGNSLRNCYLQNKSPS